MSRRNYTSEMVCGIFLKKNFFSRGVTSSKFDNVPRIDNNFAVFFHKTVSAKRQFISHGIIRLFGLEPRLQGTPTVAGRLPSGRPESRRRRDQSARDRTAPTAPIRQAGPRVCEQKKKKQKKTTNVRRRDENKIFFTPIFFVSRHL